MTFLRLHLLRVFAVIFGLLALSSLLEPFGLAFAGSFVFLGKRLSGTPNMIAAGSFALFLGFYAVALYRESAVAVPLGLAYAGYLHVNLHYSLLFTYRDHKPPFGDARVFGVVTALSLAIAWGAVVASALRARKVKTDRPPGRILLRAFALLFGLMALSNAIKPFAYAADIGLVFFGNRLTGTANTVGSLAFSALLATYAVSIWREKRPALPIGVAYAIYVIVNLVLWNRNRPDDAEAPAIFGLPYLVAAIGVSSGAALLLWRHRARLT